MPAVVSALMVEDFMYIVVSIMRHLMDLFDEKKIT